MIRLTDGTVASQREINAAGEGVTGLAAFEKDGVRYVLVAEIDARKRLILERFHDLNGDGWPDDASRTKLLTSGEESLFVVSIAARSAALMYLADARCGDILVAVDTDGDGWVDRLVPRRFARREDRPDLALVDLRYVRDPATQAHVLIATPEFGRDTADLRMPMRLFRIADGGLAPDADEMIVPADSKPVVAKGSLTSGETFIEITRGANGKDAKPRVYEAWKLGANDADLEKLGELALEPGVAKGVLVTNAPLAARWRVGIRVGGDKSTEIRFDVHPVWPVLESVAPGALPAGNPTEVTIRGTGFTPGMSVRLLRGGLSDPLKFVLVDTTTARVSIPAQTAGDAFGLVAVGVGQPMNDPIVPVRAVDVRVRSP